MNRLGRIDSSNSLDEAGTRRECFVMQPDPCPSTHLHRIDPARNMARYYNLAITPSLFGDAAVVREWGRIGKPGRMRIDLYEKAEEAAAAHAAIERAKTRRGYRDVVGGGSV
jgi:predicted DNA-binding WGR domain protein